MIKFRTRAEEILSEIRKQLEINVEIAERDHPEGPIVDGKRVKGVCHSQDILAQHIRDHLKELDALILAANVSPAFITGWDISGPYTPPEKICVNGIAYVQEPYIGTPSAPATRVKMASENAPPVHHVLGAEIRQIRESLNGVTPGPWAYTRGQLVRVMAGADSVAGVHRIGRKDEQAHSNARYIAAVNPAVVARLLDYIAALEASEGSKP